MITDWKGRVFSILWPHHTIPEISLLDQPGGRFHSPLGPALGGGE